jgi:hypothetical protein
MGFLPYFDFGGQEYHFGYHAVVACGYDEQCRQVLLADRDEALHPVSLEALARARGSRYKPFPPQHAWYEFDFNRPHPPERGEVLKAIGHCAAGMLEPPIRNLGIQGIHTAAQRIRRWPEQMGDQELRAACFNCGIMIDARGGTGGGLFRLMYARFLEEAAELTGQARLQAAGIAMQAAGDCWETVAALFDRASTAPDPAAPLAEIGKLLPELARQEQDVWSRLRW